MPDSRKHRGKHPSDAEEFSPENILKLQEAFKDVIYLINRDYPVNASVEIAGNRYRLSKRQRMAILRSVAKNETVILRKSKMLELSKTAGQEIWIDGFNLLITLETMLSGGIILKGPDLCIRDISGIHGSYRKVDETLLALGAVCSILKQHEVNKVKWFFDSPVSNSGRIAALVRETGLKNKADWEAELVFNPDKVLGETEKPVVSSDSWVLDHCKTWINLGNDLLTKLDKPAELIDFTA